MELFCYAIVAIGLGVVALALVAMIAVAMFALLKYVSGDDGRREESHTPARAAQGPDRPTTLEEWREEQRR